VATILKNNTILCGITGGVAAYKSLELVRRLKDEEASVSVIMTESACRFVTPLSFEVASQNRVYISLFDDPMAHIHLPASASVMVIAPATANSISKFANGIADNLLSTCLLSFEGKVVIAPSMNWKMYENKIVQDNLRKLGELGVIQVGPEWGPLACGETGQGRMSEIPAILEAVSGALTAQDLDGEHIVVSAGPTREYIDPVRFLSNRSSGKMGYALARAARNRGAQVTLISGPTALAEPAGIEIIRVETSKEMLSAVRKNVAHATVFIMAAAVSDFAPHETFEKKIEKKSTMLLRLRETEDIISEVSRKRKRPFIIGFAAETGKQLPKAIQKMKKKGMDMMVFNDVSEKGAGFDVETNKIIIFSSDNQTETGLIHKDAAANLILDNMKQIRT
jgi:phosphopantothenoylcysteine decarboxylase/phosphopantothenate--cysteine ligase